MEINIEENSEDFEGEEIILARLNLLEESLKNLSLEIRKRNSKSPTSTKILATLLGMKKSMETILQSGRGMISG